MSSSTAESPMAAPVSTSSAIAAPAKRSRTAAKPAAVAAPKPKSGGKPASKAKVVAKPKSAVKGVAAVRPSWKDIIKECIAENKEDVRQGVSRNTIKKFAEDKYQVDVTGTNLYQLNKAITTGAEAGVFHLPKGPSGKVKLAPKATAPSASKEVCIIILFS
ncbi:hypothetical protein B0H34DRAFT_303731 [Crassisporium funariophilum]|nr:hypothetical protein B0H34DRAFT_303731 [Crassisporium funariophilum]